MSLLRHLAWVAALADPSWGLSTVRSQAPVVVNRLSLTPGRLVPLSPGATELTVGLTHTNVWAQMPGYFFDGEWTLASLRGAYGLPGDLELQVEALLFRRGGGLLDRPIEGFHRAFGITQSRRDRYPRDRLEVETIDGRGTVVRVGPADRGVGVGNPRIALRRRLTADACAGRAPTVVAEVALKLPLGSIARQFATDHVAVLVDAGAQVRLGDAVSLLAGVGVVISPGYQELYGMELSTVQKTLLAGITVTLHSSVQLALHYLNQDGAVEKALYAPLNNTTHEFVVGVLWAPSGSRRWLLEAALIENSVHDANTPDVGGHLGARVQFGAPSPP